MIETEEQFEIDYTDASGQAKFEKCPAHFFFERLLGLRSTEGNMIAPDYGTCMHFSLPFAYSVDTLEQAYDAFDRAWENYDYGWQDNRRNPDSARASLKGFCDRHTQQLCQYEILHYPSYAETADIISPNEVPFLIDIGGKLPLAGRIDLVVRHKPTGAIWVNDYKTASQITPNYFKNFHGALQPVLYTIAGSTITGEDVKGMIIEAIRTSVPTSKLRGECQMHFCFVTDKQIEIVLEAVNDNVERMLQYNETGKWPQCPSACAPYAQFAVPGYLCPFRPLCDAPDWREQVKYYRKSKPFHPFYIDKSKHDEQETKETESCPTGSTQA